jgi:hypothetical protein
VNSNLKNKFSFDWVAALLASAIVSGSLVHAQSVLKGEPSSYKPEEIQVGLSQTACLGPCPVYSVQISGDGTIKYQGRENVAVVGSREAKIAPTEVAKIVNDFLRARFFEMPETYTGFADSVRFENGQFARRGGGVSTDGPKTVLTLRMGAKTKTISLYGRYPDELRHLGLLIDDLPDVRQWTGRKE